ncbi:aromatic amino acid ammonia-lyase [Subtercola frigoramans]|uniref:Histidine ammonia-lyase n=1 Tax=Subtercola frigoramans TaxID=120298 RepID=A0ABS2L8P9_9MICO|nr:aromatic amino acid ammonia-lyase [Subtercola frigoramans]MBM7473470.1 histidine ammonia-lyase [Subtercola frigoramans]
MKTVSLSFSSPLTLDEVQSIALDAAEVTLAPDARERIALGRAVLTDALEKGTRVYGLNTGLGHTRDVEISRDVLDQYQVDIVVSHAFGIGPSLPEPEVRAIMLARLAGAVRGYSGLSLPVAEFYSQMLNAGVVPNVPREGSIGASDLGTLAAIAATMIGRGTAFLNGTKLSSAQALQQAGLQPITLGLKEGLAVVSENSYSIGIGALALGEVARTLRLADVAAALTMEAARSSLTPFDPEVAVARSSRSQADVAANILSLLEGSYLTDPLQAISLQDPLSIRTVAQVHGAARAVFDNLAFTVETELNASDDNPMTSPDTGRALSTGNFHPMEIALGFESIRVALAHLALICERRVGVIGMEFWSSRASTDVASLPGGAILTPGLGGYAHAAISARIRTLANPVTLNIPSLDHGQEDHATAAPLAVDFTRELTAKLNDMLAGEIIIASALLSWRADVTLGAGTRPYFDVVVQAAKEGAADELGGELVARATPRLVEMTSRGVHLSRGADSAPDVHPSTGGADLGSFAPTPLYRSRKKALTDELHNAAAG